MPKRYNPNDKWARRAKDSGYRARSVFKLAELDQRDHLFASGMTVLDIGAAPGSWLQYISERVGPKGRVIGIDLQEIEPVAENVTTYVCDLTDHDAVQKCLDDAEIDECRVIVSDIAPSTSGIKARDQHLSVELSKDVFALAKKLLKKNGVLVMKVFQGPEFDAFLAGLKVRFKRVKVREVQATRESSREVYVVCSRLKV